MPNNLFYKTLAWKNMRKRVMKRDKYQCQNCGGSVRKLGTGFVDHIMSRRRAPELSLTESNLQTLCRTCHNKKTDALDGGFGRAPRPTHLPPSLGVDASGLPLNPDHPWRKSNG